ncbi:MAG: vitamin K epoxide reductase family protein [Nocardioidaceae bacterium]
MSIAGLAAAGYLTYEHFTAATTLACPDTGAINCVKVTTSSYSRVLGIPVAVLGVGYFAVMTLLCLPSVWRSSDPSIAWVRLLLSGVGLLFVLYLIWVELFRVDAICLWCTAVHALTVLLFGTLAVARALREPDGTGTS